MPTKRPEYHPEFRRRIVELVRAGHSPEELAQKYEPCGATIRAWAKQADIDDGVRADGMTTVEREELAALRREVATLREEREILKKAAAWFAQEAGSNPRRGSRS